MSTVRRRHAEPSPISILEAFDDPHLFAPLFEPASTWAAWRAFFGAVFALPMTEEQLELYRRCTGRETAPTEQSREAWAICGRRGGKSRAAGLIAVDLAVLRDYRPFLAAGERATIMVIAADRRQARTVLRYITGLLEGVPMLRRLIEAHRTEAIDLANRVTIEVHTASFRTIRGYTIAAAILDEVAFWPTDDAAEPDTEILAALKPGMATIPGSLLLAISSPYARKGALWRAYKQHFGKDDSPVLVWKADTRSMNPTVPEDVIRAAYEEDEAAASAEYGAEFRRDVESFVSLEVIDAAVVPGRAELPAVASQRYAAFVDPSGGSADSMTLAIAHVERRDKRDQAGTVVVDCLRERRPPFSPDDVVAEFCALLATYRVRSVTGDRYGGEWCREPFRRRGVSYELAAKAKSDIYRDVLPLLNSGRVELLDDKRLRAQLVGLERRTARGGRDSIDHAPSGHDDVANAVCGVIASLATRLTPLNPLDYIR